MEAWNGRVVGKRKKRIWKIAPSHIIWTIWKQRNYIAFEEEKMNVQEWKLNLLTSMWSWAKLVSKEDLSTFVQFTDWLVC